MHIHLLQPLRIYKECQQAAALFDAYQIREADTLASALLATCTRNCAVLDEALYYRAVHGCFKQAGAMLETWRKLSSTDHRAADLIEAGLLRGMNDMHEAVEGAFAFMQIHQLSHPELGFCGCIPDAPLCYQFILDLGHAEAQALDEELQSLMAPYVQYLEGKVSFSCHSRLSLEEVTDAQDARAAVTL